MTLEIQKDIEIDESTYIVVERKMKYNLISLV